MDATKQQAEATQEPQVNEQNALVVKQQDYQLSVFESEEAFETAYKMATCLSKSQLVPAKFQGKPDDCLIALDISKRIGLSPLMVLQNIDVIQGKPSWSSKACIALINRCGKYSTDIDWEFEANHNGKGLSARAFAVQKSDNKVVYGSWVTWEIVEKEGWLTKNGSKWKTFPEKMMRYRAASWFAGERCPEVLLGLPTTDEVEDVYGNPSNAGSTKIINAAEQAAAFIEAEEVK